MKNKQPKACTYGKSEVFFLKPTSENQAQEEESIQRFKNQQATLHLNMPLKRETFMFQ